MIQRFADRDAADQALLAQLTQRLQQALAARERICLAVSGGTTPGPLFRLLANTALDWDRISVTLVDERWVDPDAAASNERLVREMLLNSRAAAATFVPLKIPYPTPAAAAALVEQRLHALPLPFAAALLGMGADGHTASWFADAPELTQALSGDSLCAPITPGQAPHQRLTLTLAALAQSEWLALQIAGADKWATLQRALQPGPVAELPVRALLRLQQPPLAVFWAP
jgi:6-phosphogluconolactonase